MRGFIHWLGGLVLIWPQASPYLLQAQAAFHLGTDVAVLVWAQATHYLGSRVSVFIWTETAFNLGSSVLVSIWAHAALCLCGHAYRPRLQRSTPRAYTAAVLQAKQPCGKQEAGR
eukprot:1153799-Pelagomonas_calceolata.AAC.5